MFGRKKKEHEETESGDTAGFGAEAPSGGRSRLTPEDVQKKEFRLAFRRGYREDEVDQFLDEVTEDLAALHQENKRLREQVADRGGAPPSGEALRDAERRAADIVRQAREYAARVIEDAEKREARPSTPAPASFLIRERDFLQRMASLIQEHAEALKSEARTGRAAGEPVAAQPAATGTPPPPMVGEPGEATPASGSPSASPSAPWPQEPTRPHDPLLEEWEGTLSGEGRSQAPEEGSVEEEFFTEPTREPRRDREEQSLRDLFWGEE